MNRAIESLGIKDKLVLVDSKLKIKDCNLNQECIVKAR